MRVIINNEREFKAEEFAFDGCHKFYLIEDYDAHRMMTEMYGYEEEDFYDIKELPRLWEDSCPLRFINMSTSLETVIPQCIESVSINVADELSICYVA